MREYSLVLSVAALVTYLLTSLVRRLALRFHAMTEIRDRDVHAIPTPRWGGIAILGGFAAAFQVARHLPVMQNAIRGDPEVPGVLLAGTFICAIGVIDDRWELDAVTKLAAQVLAAGIAVYNGVQVLYLPEPGSQGSFLSLGPDVGVPVTVLFIVFTTNALNFIDGLDGLAAGVGAISALSFFAYSYRLSHTHGFLVMSPPTLLTAILAGACLGFLPHNFNPARIFMGDSGSMLVGLSLGAAMVTTTATLDPSQLQGPLDLAPTLLPLILPFAVLAVPFIDLVAAVVRRTRAGRSPFSPDKLHLHHRLLEIGHSHRRAVLIMYFWTALLGSVVVSLSANGGPVLVGSVAGGVAVLGVLAMGAPRLARRLSRSRPAPK